ncbi:MAG: tyrosine-type recombinase/integrase [Candidatus Fimenecus sp.]
MQALKHKAFRKKSNHIKGKQLIFNKKGTKRDAHQHMPPHTFVTNCIDAGVKPEIVQKNVGHASIETTFDIYNEVRKISEKSELQKVNDFYSSHGLSTQDFSESGE